MPGSRSSAPGTEGMHTLSLGVFVFLCLSHTCTPDWGEGGEDMIKGGDSLHLRGRKEFTCIFLKE